MNDAATLVSTGIFLGDTVNFTSTSATFADKNVGSAKTVTVAGITASGTDAGNYTLNNTTATTAANITPLAITVAASGANKIYDGGVNDAATLASMGILSGDTVNFTSTTATFANKNVGSAKTVTVDGITASGTDAGNYTLNNTMAVTTANITPLAITVAATGANKVYDGGVNDVATLASTGILSGDTVNFAGTSATFANKNVGLAKTVTVAGITASGTDAGNYTLNNTTATTAANITPLAITVAAAGANKVYDGGVNDAATLASTGILSGDTVNFADTSATFANKNVGLAKTVAVAGITASGTDAGNYTLNNTTAVTTANITPLAITVAATGANKVYDGGVNDVAALASTGILSGDTVNFADMSAIFANKNVGSAKTVTVAGITASGTDAGNYTFNTMAVTTANITPLAITVAATGVNKVYDGGVNDAVTLTSTGILLGDTVNFADTSATFANKNVGSVKTVTVAGIMASGTDAGNYTLSNTTVATAANITQLDSVMWTGGLSGNWSNASNWAGGALPDGSNVLAVSIPAGVNVTYDAAVASTVLPTFTSAGNLVLTGTNLSIGSFNQTAGNLTGTGGLNVTNNFSQTGGTIALTGTAIANITQATGNLSIANLSAPTVNLTASTGAIVAGQITAGSVQLSAATGIGSASTPLQLVTSNLNGTTNTGGINISNNPTTLVTLAKLTTSDDSAVTYKQNGQDLNLIGNMSSAGGGVLIDPPVNFTMSNTAQVSSGGGAIDVQASGNVVLAAINAGSGAVNLSVGGNVLSANGFTGSNMIGGLATINVGGNANFASQVQMLKVSGAGSFTVVDTSGTVYTNDAVVQQAIAVVTANISNITNNTTSSSLTSSTSNGATSNSSTAPINSVALSSNIGASSAGTSNTLGMLSSTGATIGGATGTFGGSDPSVTTPLTTGNVQFGSAATQSTGSSSGVTSSTGTTNSVTSTGDTSSSGVTSGGSSSDGTQSVNGQSGNGQSDNGAGTVSSSNNSDKDKSKNQKGTSNGGNDKDNSKGKHDAKPNKC